MFVSNVVIISGYNTHKQSFLRVQRGLKTIRFENWVECPSCTHLPSRTSFKKLNQSRESQTWVQMPTPLPPSGAILGKSCNSSDFQFLHLWKRDVIMGCSPPMPGTLMCSVNVHLSPFLQDQGTSHGQEQTEDICWRRGVFQPRHWCWSYLSPHC